MENIHTERSPQTIAPVEEEHPHGGDWLEQIVFGLNDGLVTTLVFIMVVSGVGSSRLVLVVLGEILAGGISMTLGGYLSSTTIRDIRSHRVATEREEIEQEPDEERQELHRIYYRKGLRGSLLDRVVDHLTADKDRWLHAMMADEHGMVEEDNGHALLDGLKIGASFIVGGLIPLIPFLIPIPDPQIAAYVLTALTVIAFGALKSKYTLKGPLRSGLEFLVVVTFGSVAGALVGHVLHAV